MKLALRNSGRCEEDSRSTYGYRGYPQLHESEVVEWLGLKPTKDGSWFTVVNTKERPTKGVIKNVDLRIGGWTGKADFNIIHMDELGDVSLVAEARTCLSQSQRFKGPCVSDTNCASVCHTEGFHGGDCRGLRRRCFCTKHC
ncbi:hypothetical protein RJ639_030477 [Escallonia herrerae]|uniref:Knottins-like domain-containing protein n=1 Tax=Escallonia herrerae TaxID=1293975 RepID=A0AA89BBL6_9ASTE|nr:hypothetical protein RJ639_030477 [Escallonia herrerae]